MYLCKLIVIALTALWLGLGSGLTLSASAMPDHSSHGHHGGGDPTVPAVFSFDPEAESWFNTGLDRLYAKDYDGAIAAFSQSLMIEPDYRVYLQRGEVYSKTGAWNQAIADYTQTLSMASADDFYVHSLRGMAWEAVGDVESAIADYTETIRIYPTDGIGYAKRGALYTKLGKILAAHRDFEEAIKQNSGRPEAYWGRGSLRLKLGNPAGALTDYQTAFKLFTEQGNTAEAEVVAHQIAQLEVQLSNPA